jgi:H+/Cl- antiporter ClcA
VFCGIAAIAVFWVARMLKRIVVSRRLWFTPMVGLAVGGLAVAFQAGTSHSSSEVLFSGQSALPGLIQHASSWTAGALVLVVVCKGVAYSLSLSSFRGGPVFPSLFIGAAVGIAFSHLPGLPMIDGAAIGIGAMFAGAVRLPMTAVLLTVLFLAPDAADLTPLVIVAVIVSYVTATRLTPHEAPAPTTPGAQSSTAARRT